MRPVWGDGERRVEGPDEDGFTLAVAALERVVAGAPSVFSRGLDAIELVGEFPVDTEEFLPAAIGGSDLEIRRHPTDPSSVAQAVRNAAQVPGDRTSVVVTVDLAAAPGTSRPPGNAVAIAAAFAVGKGATYLGSALRHHPADRRLDAAAWIAAARRAAPDVNEGSSGVLGVAATAAPPVLLAEWARAFPNAPAVHLPWAPGAPTSSPASVLFLALHHATHRASAGQAIWAAAIRPDRTDVLAFRYDAHVAWLGAFGLSGPGRPPPRPPTHGSGDPPLDAVSQGAYVPRATYLGNLPARWRFAAQRCAACGTTTFPPRDRCGECRATEGLTTVFLPTQGLEVEAATVVAPGAQPTEFDRWVAAVGSYGVVLARLAPGARATLQVTDSDPGAVRVGSRVDGVLRRIYATEGAWRYGRKAVLVAEAPSAPGPPAEG